MSEKRMQDPSIAHKIALAEEQPYAEAGRLRDLVGLEGLKSMRERALQDPDIAHEMALVEKPYREKKRVFGLVGPSKEEIEKGEAVGESIGLSVAFEKRATEIEGKVEDFSITSRNFSHEYDDTFRETFNVQFSTGGHRVQIRFTSSYRISNDREVYFYSNLDVGDNSEMVIDDLQLGLLKRTDRDELFKNFYPLLEIKAKELVLSRREEDFQEKREESRREWEKRRVNLTSEAEKKEELKREEERKRQTAMVRDVIEVTK